VSIDFRLDPRSGPTVALYLFTCFSVLVTIYVYKIRGGMSGIVNTRQFRLSYLVIPVNILASVSNLCIIPTYLRQGGFGLVTACAIVICRGIVALICFGMIYSIFSNEALKVFLNPNLLILGRYSWTAVLVISFVDISCLRFLPWSDSEFASRSNGFPTMWFFRVCMYSQCLVAFISVVTSDVQTLTLQSLINFVFSLISLMVNGIAILMGIVAEDIKQYDTTIVSKKEATLLTTISNSIFRDSSRDPSSASSSVDTINSFLASMSRGTKDLEDERRRLDQEKATVAATAERLERIREALGIDNDMNNKLKPFSSSIAFADENTTVLVNQLQKAGIKPLQYIPLHILREELQELFVKASAGQPFNEGRVDHLLACMEVNPEYMAEKEAQDKAWREEVGDYTLNSLSEMRGFVPPFIFTATKAALVQEWQIGPDLAKRLTEKKCLWMLRMNEEDIKRLHEADLMSRYNYEGQGLDIVEIAALYAVIPSKFSNDATGRKRGWQSKLEVLRFFGDMTHV
jgi:hypothetical protein